MEPAISTDTTQLENEFRTEMHLNSKLQIYCATLKTLFKLGWVGEKYWKCRAIIVWGGGAGAHTLVRAMGARLDVKYHKCNNTTGLSPNISIQNIFTTPGITWQMMTNCSIFQNVSLRWHTLSRVHAGMSYRLINTI